MDSPFPMLETSISVTCCSFHRKRCGFKLKGERVGGGKPLQAIIPFKGERMFESGYTIDDLLIGKVGIVGICKGTITPDQMKSPLDYFQRPSDSKCIPQDDVVVCGESTSTIATSDVGVQEVRGYYIGILAVIQAVFFEV